MNKYRISFFQTLFFIPLKYVCVVHAKDGRCLTYQNMLRYGYQHLNIKDEWIYLEGVLASEMDSLIYILYKSQCMYVCMFLTRSTMFWRVWTKFDICIWYTNPGAKMGERARAQRVCLYSLLAHPCFLQIKYTRKQKLIASKPLQIPGNAGTGSINRQIRTKCIPIRVVRKRYW